MYVDHESYMNDVIHDLSVVSLFRHKDGYAIQPIIDEIERGSMSREDVICSLDSFTLDSKASLIRTAFMKYNTMVIRAARDRFRQRVIYITGDGGTGKTNLAKLFATRKLFDRPNDSYCLASGSHAVESYKGQSTFIFDDYRPSLLKYTDFLNLFDPNNLNEISDARFCPAVVFTDFKVVTASTNYNPKSIYVDLRDTLKAKYEMEEDPEQVYRRLPFHIHFNPKTSRIDVFVYQPYDYNRSHRSKSEWVFYKKISNLGLPNCYRIYDRIVPDGYHCEFVDGHNWLVPNGNDFESSFIALRNMIYDYFGFPYV